MSMAHVVCNKEADIAVIKNDMATVKQDVGDIKKSLLGNGVPGLTTRTAKLEQICNGFLWAVGVIGTAVLGLVVAELWRIMRV